MTQIWSLRGIPATKKFILVKLADNADDDGKCWPSVGKIASECEVSNRTVQIAINWAEKRALLSRKIRPGRSTVYYITPAGNLPAQNLHSEDCDITPADNAPLPPQDIRLTCEDYGNAYIEEPSIEPSVEPPKNRKPSGNVSCTKSFEQFWETFPRQRRGSREKTIAAYQKAMKRATEEEIYDGLVRYSTSSDVQRGYAKGAESWLNDDGWTYQPVDPSAQHPFNRKPAYGDSGAKHNTFGGKSGRYYPSRGEFTFTDY